MAASATRQRSWQNKHPRFKCSVCNYNSNRKSNLMRHERFMHATMKTIEKCCGIEFITKSELRAHVAKFHTNGYLCRHENCGKLFERRALLRRHQASHSKEKRFACDKCKFRTKHKPNLERHCKTLNHSSKQLDEDSGKNPTSFTNAPRLDLKKSPPLPSECESSPVSFSLNCYSAPPSLAGSSSTDNLPESEQLDSQNKLIQQENLKNRKVINRSDPTPLSFPSAFSSVWRPFGQNLHPLPPSITCTQSSIVRSPSGQIPEPILNNISANSHQLDSMHFNDPLHPEPIHPHPERQNYSGLISTRMPPYSAPYSSLILPSYSSLRIPGASSERQNYADLISTRMPPCSAPYSSLISPSSYSSLRNPYARNPLLHNYPPIPPLGYFFPPINVMNNYTSYFHPLNTNSQVF